MLSFTGVYPDYKNPIGERAEDIIDAWWIVVPQLAREDLIPENLDIMFNAIKKSGLTTEKAAKRSNPSFMPHSRES